MTRHCSLPDILGFREWFEKRFRALCRQHDINYVHKHVTRKEADIDLAAGMMMEGYPVLAFATYFLWLRPFGWLYWNDILGN